MPKYNILCMVSSEQQQRILTLMTEIEGYKRSIQKEQEQNEKLVRIHSNAESDMATVKRQFAQCIAKHNALKIEYATFTRMLHETEQALNRANTVSIKLSSCKLCPNNKGY